MGKGSGRQSRGIKNSKGTRKGGNPTGPLSPRNLGRLIARLPVTGVRRTAIRAGADSPGLAPSDVVRAPLVRHAEADAAGQLVAVVHARRDGVHVRVHANPVSRIVRGTLRRDARPRLSHVVRARDRALVVAAAGQLVRDVRRTVVCSGANTPR